MLAVPVFSLEFSDSAEVRFYYRTSPSEPFVIKRENFSMPRQAVSEPFVVYSITNSATSRVMPRFFDVPCTGTLSGAVGLYLSFYFASSYPATVTSPDYSTYPAEFRVHFIDGAVDYFDISSVSSFPVSSPVDGYSYSSGYLVRGRFSLDSIVDVSGIDVSLGGGSTSQSVAFAPLDGAVGSVYAYIPSFVLVSGLSFSDLGELENIADSISQQSGILNAMYGDIMQLLNDLYTRLGDMQAVEELTNTYFAQLIPLVNSINTNTANIYSLLQTQFQLLRTLIATESGDIQAAIEQQTDDLIAYFDTVFSGATGDMPEKSDDLQSSVGDFSDAESGYQSNATERFEELATTFSGFSGGTLAGVTLASTLFTRVLNALGQYNIVYYFPLLLGLSLVIIGRLPRGSGGQSSSEKHRGDSSA